MILDLVLKRKWYEMIQNGEKTEEYRKISDYWVRRLCGVVRNLETGDDEVVIKRFTHVKFHLGRSNKRTMLFKIKDFTIGQGNVEWGAPENEDVFIIKLGERVLFGTRII